LAKNLVGKQFGKGFYESKDLTDFVQKGDKKIPYQVLAECKGAI
jgi:isoleucyl-tRNA synthetase